MNFAYLWFGDNIWGQFDNGKISFANCFFQLIITDSYQLIHVGGGISAPICRTLTKSIERLFHNRSFSFSKCYSFGCRAVFSPLFFLLLNYFFIQIDVDFLLIWFIRVCHLFVFYTENTPPNTEINEFDA